MKRTRNKHNAVIKSEGVVVAALGGPDNRRVGE